MHFESRRLIQTKVIVGWRERERRRVGEVKLKLKLKLKRERGESGDEVITSLGCF